MSMNDSLYFGMRMSEQKDAHIFPPVPMVYEHVPEQTLNWEYHVLSIDPREKVLPSTSDLNELGNAGWLLVSSIAMRVATSFDHFDELGNANRLREGRESERQQIYYYFVRQKRA
ncbi:MAG: hypothetical protein NVS3B14_13620 [Ktedonobacteraceae bacterium]